MLDLISRSHRLVHLDLKGAPPKTSYLEKLFPLFKEWGATGLLLEWEDTFPFHGGLSIIGSKKESGGKPYSEDDIKHILRSAKECGLIAIPLVQTFGHLEFLLKHEDWKCLREVPRYPSSICPSHASSQDVVMEMVGQVIDFHYANSELEYLHIGADEVWHLGLCETCLQRSEGTLKGRAQLFLGHVLSIAKKIKELYPSLKLIMWDDMLRGIPCSQLQDIGVGQYIEPMVWLYCSSDTFCIPEGLWEKYSSTFSSVWVASSYKGATGSCQQLPILSHHASNHERWLKELPVIASKFETFHGIALTGWSRYDHFATLCEMLSVSLPCLALCLCVWNHNGFLIQNVENLSKTLGDSAPQLLSMESIARPKPIPAKLSYPGWKAFIYIESFFNLENKIQIHLDSSQFKTWLNPWQIKNNFGNPMHLETFLPILNHLLSELETTERLLRESLEPLIYFPAIEEWMATWFEPTRKKVEKLYSECQVLLKNEEK